MENLLSYVYEGGIYRFEDLAELLDDIGMHIIRREDTAVSTTAIFSVPQDDLAIIESKAREIGGEMRKAALAGSEIAVVAPSSSSRHLPHPTCDIAEYLRRAGAQTVLVCLARGFGQDPLMDPYERCLINECDLAVFIFGDSKHCMEKKSTIFEQLTAPIVVTGGPAKCRIPPAKGYVGGFGRRVERVKSKKDISNLDRLVRMADKVLTEKKNAIYPDLPELVLSALGRRIEEQIPEIGDVLSPAPITVKVDGLRIKLPYEKYNDRIRDIEFEGKEIGDFSTVSRSVLKGHMILRLDQTFSLSR